MIKQKVTIVATACMLLLSIVLLATASWAWFTLSSAPEISGMSVTLFADRALLVSKTGEQDDFHQSIDISELFADYAPLKPISTVDGVNWFLPNYEASSGILLDPSSYTLADPAQNMNVSLYKGTGNDKTMLTGKELFDAKNRGYYVSASFYLATEYEENVTVTLSAPDRANNNLEPWETKEPDDGENKHAAKYGSYALSVFERDEDDGQVYKIDNNAQNALRVGFIVDSEDANENEKDRFVIYEPNADKRSLRQNEDGTIKKPEEENGYVYGYTIGEDFVDGNYIPTSPIAVGDDNKGTLGTVDPQNLIVQTGGKWADSAKQDVAAGRKPNSNDVETFGKFVSDSSTLDGVESLAGSATALASATQIVELEARDADGTLKPKKVTMYVWIEGQDVDCWNDVANGTFAVNLEFAAVETKIYNKDGTN